MKRDFGGEAAAYYRRFRHGYPSAVIDVLARAFELTGQDVVVDLGCGTGQLTLPMARHVRAVIGVEVEPDMLDAVVTNGTPLWLQETGWSRALRDVLEQRLGTTLTYPCGTDEQSQRCYREDLQAAGFDVFTTAVDHVATLDLSQLVGSVYSAMGSRTPAASQRTAFAEQIRVTILAGTR